MNTTRDNPAAVVTGAAQGIGLAIATRLAGGGHPVMLTDAREDVHAAADRLRAQLPPDAVVASTLLDVTDEESVAAAFAVTAEQIGIPLVLVNNAGVSRPAPTLETTRTHWEQVLAVNLTGPFLCSRAALPAMREAGFGRIVMVSSFNAKSAPVNGDNASYAASKAGLTGLVHNLAVEFGAAGVTVNAVAPGIVDTELLRGAHPEERFAQLRSRIPTGAFTTPEQIADVVAFLSSPGAGAVTGEVVNVNGGLYFD